MMYNNFYCWHNNQLTRGLYDRDQQDGTPSPPVSKFLITENGIQLITENGIQLITEAE